MGQPYQPGRVVAGRYRLRSLLSRGGMGAVWRAEQLSLGREVALKVLRAKYAGRADALVRFEREARAICDLSHPNLVTYYDYGRDEDGRPFLVMELIPGAPGTTLVGRVPPLGLDDIVHVVSQLARALTAAHAVGVVHRDLKWSNVMVTPVPGDPLFVKLIDFGVLTVAAESPEADRRRVQELTDLGDRIGTPRTMSPEQALGQPVDPRSDQYALGLMTWELLAGRPPFQAADPREILRMQVEEAPPPLSEAGSPYQLPRAFERAVLKAMAKRPADRFRTVEDFRRALAASRLGLRGRMEVTTRRVLHALRADHQDTAIDFQPNRLEARRPEPLLPTPADLPRPVLPTAAPRSRLPLVLAACSAAVALVALLLWAASDPPTQPATATPSEPATLTAPEPATATATEPATPTKPAAEPATATAPATEPATAAATASEPATATEPATPTPTATAPATEPATEPVRAPAPAPTPTPPPRPSPASASRPAAHADGFLTVSAKPWARVSVDGAPLGVTPVLKRALAPGTYTVTLTHDTLGAQTHRVRISPGAERRLTVDLSRR